MEIPSSGYLWMNIYLESLKAASIDEFLTSKLNEKLMEGMDWLFYDHPVTGERGFVSYIDMEDMPSGKYFIELSIKEDRNGALETCRYREMPFIKE